jgi:hypothetical protein
MLVDFVETQKASMRLAIFGAGWSCGARAGWLFIDYQRANGFGHSWIKA